MLDWWNRRGEYAEAELFTFAALMALYAPDTGFEPEDNAGSLDVIRRAWSEGSGYADIVRRIVGGGVFVADFESAVPGFSEKVAVYLEEIKRSGMQEALRKFLDGRR